jgi:hypothetical protein
MLVWTARESSTHWERLRARCAIARSHLIGTGAEVATVGHRKEEMMSSSANIERRGNGFRTWCWRCHREDFFERLADAHEYCLHHDCQSL